MVDVNSPGERRHVTALFYDIVGSSSLLELTDPEDFSEAQLQIHKIVKAAIASEGGFIDRAQGDGGFAFFGFPEPNEDAAHCAVAAATTALAQCLSSGIVVGGIKLRIRFGVATGNVVLRRLNGDLVNGTQLVGLALNLAARIQSEADPNTIAVANSTYELTKASFQYEQIGVRKLKGFEAVQQLWRPLKIVNTTDRFTALGRLDGYFVARSSELEHCSKQWSHVRTGEGRLIVITGEPGIGKSRFVAALRRKIGVSAAGSNLYQCQPRGNSQPLYPLLDSLERELRQLGTSEGLREFEPLSDLLLRYAPELTPDAARVITFLMQGAKSASGMASNLSELSDFEFRRRVGLAVVQLFIAMCKAGPQIAVFEDFQWADSLTAFVVERLATACAELPLLLIITSREERDTYRFLAQHVHSLSLAPLTEDTVHELVGKLWNDRAASKLSQLIHDISDGIPLFVGELVRFLKDQGDANLELNVKEVRKLFQNHEITSLNSLLHARLAAAGSAQRVAQVASVIGREFTWPQLSALSDTSQSELFHSLEELQRLGLIVTRIGGDGRPAYLFRHGLLHEAAYQTLLKSERALLHGKLVRFVEDGDIPPMSDELMAWHCERSGRLLEAARYALKAAEACSTRFALKEAKSLLDTAEENLAQAGTDTRTRDLLLEVLTLKGTVATGLFGTGSREAREVYELGVAICRDAEVENPEKWFPLYWGWWFTSPDFDARQGRSKIIIDDLNQARDPEIRLQAYHCAWAANFHSARYHECLECIQQGLSLYDNERARAARVKFGGHDAKVCGIGERAQALWFIGYPEEASQVVGEAVKWAEQCDHVGSLCHAIDSAMLVGFYRRDNLAVHSFASRLNLIGRERELPGAVAKSLIYQGWAEGKETVDRGISLVRQGLEYQRCVGTQEDLPIYLSILAELLERSESFDEALKVVDEGVEQSLASADKFWLPELYRQRAILSMAVGYDQEAAGKNFELSISLAREHQSISLLKRAQMSASIIGFAAPGT